MQAYEQWPEKREVEVLSIVPDKKELGKLFKREATLIADSLTAMKEAEALALKAVLEASGSAPYTIAGSGQKVTLTKAMVAIAKEKRMEGGRNIIPAVIEPSFGIGRIIYCLLEHSFATRNGDAARVVFTFPPIVAPVRCTVFPLQQDTRLETHSHKITAALVAAGISTKGELRGRRRCTIFFCWFGIELFDPRFVRIVPIPRLPPPSPPPLFLAYLLSKPPSFSAHVTRAMNRSGHVFGDHRQALRAHGRDWRALCRHRGLHLPHRRHGDPAGARHVRAGAPADERSAGRGAGHHRAGVDVGRGGGQVPRAGIKGGQVKAASGDACMRL